MKMQAALWYGPEEMRVEEVEVPRIGTDEVLVRIGAALTCGTDFKLFRQGHALLVKCFPKSLSGNGFCPFHSRSATWRYNRPSLPLPSGGSGDFFEKRQGRKGQKVLPIPVLSHSSNASAVPLI